MYGLGNWGEVSEHVGTKNRTECYEHYMEAYMNSPFSPLPVGYTKPSSLEAPLDRASGANRFLCVRI